MATKHTQGPWIIRRVANSKRNAVRIVDQKTHSIIAEIKDVDTGSEAIANAKLITSAPDMAEALCELLDVYMNDQGYLEDVEKRVRAALIKAGVEE